MLIQKYRNSNQELHGKQRDENQRAYAGNTAQADPLPGESSLHPPDPAMY